MLEENHLPVTDENIFIVGCPGQGHEQGYRLPVRQPPHRRAQGGRGAAAPALRAASSAAPSVNTNGTKVAGTNTYCVALKREELGRFGLLFEVIV